ncbi:MAG: GNAT family N-acetyltransferase [Chloroflexi bacterium]|nr:GNAT family N-acetyltransferase [Chloroflexota bacterium]
MTQHAHSPLPHDLGDGLLLRRSTPADADTLAEINGRLHADPPAIFDERIAVWTRDLLSGNHPTFGTGDFTIVEDTRTGKIVSSLNLISQTWAYDGIPFGVGRPELVGTEPGYRKRGLVRVQFEEIHRWSAERGELVQAITGIPFYYRQFGYEMAMNLHGGRIGYAANVPKLKEGEVEAFRFRLVGEADLPFLAEVEAYGSRRWRVTCLRDATLWRYEVSGKSPGNVNRLEFCVIETAAGEPVGVVGHSDGIAWNRLGTMLVELKPGVSWLAVAPCLLRYLRATGEQYAVRDGKLFEGLGFWMGADHPLLQITKDRLPNLCRPYAWYLRVPDLPAFLRHIAPALEARLARSAAVGHTGDLKLDFYRDGLRLAFENGRLTTVEPWTATRDDGGSVGFPGLTFLQLLFGHRTLEELQAAFADCWVDGDDARALLNALFPKQASSFWPMA